VWAENVLKLQAKYTHRWLNKAMNLFAFFFSLFHVLMWEKINNRIVVLIKICMLCGPAGLCGISDKVNSAPIFGLGLFFFLVSLMVV